LDEEGDAMARVASRFGLGSIVTTGIVAGIIFAVFEMLATAILMGPEAAVMPLRMIGAMALGPAALEPGYALEVAAMTGVIVHMILSVVFTGIFAAIASPLTSGAVGERLSASGSLALAGVIFGIVLWLMNFYVVAPVAGWAWFPERTNPVVQFLAHALFFGAPVGWMLARSRVLIRPTI
jgi:ammonia channel protein AmtB